MDYKKNEKDYLTSTINQLENIKFNLRDLSDLIIDFQTSVTCFLYLNKDRIQSDLPNSVISKLSECEFTSDFINDFISDLPKNMFPKNFDKSTWENFFERDANDLSIFLMKNVQKSFLYYLHFKLSKFYDDVIYTPDLKETLSNLDSFNNFSKKLYFTYFILRDIKADNFNVAEDLNINDFVTTTIIQLLKLTTSNNEILSTEVRRLKNSEETQIQEFKDLKKEFKTLQKTNKSITQKLADITSKNLLNESKMINALKKEMKDSLKKHETVTYNVLKNSYESMNEININTISDLKIEVKELKLKNKKLSEDCEELLMKLKDYENRTPKISKNDLLQEVAVDLANTLEVDPVVMTLSNNSLKEDENEISASKLEEPSKNLIGYVTFNGDQILVNYLNKETSILKNIPKSVLLADHQFVLTTEGSEFVYSYKQYYTDGASCGEFCKITTTGDKIFADNGGAIFEINPGSLTLKTDYIIGVVNNLEVKKLFKSLDFMFDTYSEYIQIRNFKPYYVIECLFNELLVYDMFTGERKYLPMVNEYVSKDYILIMDENTPILTFKNSKFYLNSAYYQNYRVGYVNFDKNKTVFTDSNTFETCNIAIPNNIDDGTVVKVDEFNRFITALNSSVEMLPVNAKKVKNKKVSQKEKFELDKIILIVGDIQLRQSYENTFAPLGYEAKVISGFDGYNKVYQEANKADIIVVTEGFVDHNIMWNLKKYYNNLFFAKNKGANYIANQIQAQAVSRKQICLNS